MANAFAQIGAVTAMNVRNIPQRWSSSLVAVLGIGGVTLVLVALLSIAAGFSVALEGSGSDDVAMVMRSGSNNEMVELLLDRAGHRGHRCAQHPAQRQERATDLAGAVRRGQRSAARQGHDGEPAAARRGADRAR